MSTDPTGLNGKNCITATSRQYINYSITKEDWCSYDGDCLSYDLILNGDEICLYCKFRKHLDIPKRLKECKEKKYEST